MLHFFRIFTFSFRVFRLASFLVGSIFFVLLFLEVLAAISGMLNTKLSGFSKQPGPEYYRQMPWMKDFWQEYDRLIFKWEPYVYWRMEPFHGKTIHIDDQGQRETGGSRSLSSDQVKIFVFGGSAMWGVGARDDYTIPSLLYRNLSNQGNSSIRLVNFSQLAYVSTQEVIVLIRELQKGNIPDAVVFYDGANDTASAFMNGAAGLTLFESSRVEEFSVSQAQKKGRIHFWKQFLMAYWKNTALYKLLGRFHWVKGNQHWNSVNNNVAQSIVSTYSFNVQMVEMLAQKYRFRPFFFWQPLLYTKKHLTPHEQEYLKRSVTPQARQDTLDIYSKIEQSAVLQQETHFHNFSHVLDDDPGVLFLDNVHLFEAGNEIIAKKMADEVFKGLVNAKNEH